MRRNRKFVLWACLGLCGFFLLAIVSAVLLARSEWFRNAVRDRIVREVEEVTGGRAEIGTFTFDWRNLEAEVRPFVLRGEEGPDEPPLFQARSVLVGLKVVSAWRRDIYIDLLHVERPELHVLVYEDGRNNLPQPKRVRRPIRDPAEELLALAVRTLRLEDGVAQFGSRAIPIDVRGEGVKLNLVYEAGGPRYTGGLSILDLNLGPAFSSPGFSFDSELSLEADRLEISSAQLAREQSSVLFTGAIENLSAPRLTARFEGGLSIKELREPLGLPLLPQGAVNAAGTISFAGREDYAITAHVTGSGLGLRSGDTRVTDIQLASEVSASPRRIEFRELRMAALGGSLTGRAEVRGLRHFTAKGEVKGLQFAELARLADAPARNWSGLVSGPVSVEGDFEQGSLHGVVARGSLEVTAAAGELPVKGSIDAAFDQSEGLLALNHSHLSTPSSEVRFRGILGRRLQVEIESSDLDDFLPLAAGGEALPPESLPVKLSDGTATFRGEITGRLEDLHIEGHAALKSFVWEGRRVDRLAAGVSLSGESFRANPLVIEQGQMRVTGEARIGLEHWRVREESSLAASLSVRGAELHRLLEDAGRDWPLEGTVTGSIEVAGTVGDPSATGTFRGLQTAVYGEKFDLVELEARYGGRSLEVTSARLQAGEGEVRATAAFAHEADSWERGSGRFTISGRGLPLSRSQSFARFAPDIDGKAEFEASGELRVHPSETVLTALQGRVALRDLTLDGKPAGSLSGTATTKPGVLTIQTEGDIAGTRIAGHGAWRLEGEFPLEGELEFEQASLSALRPWWAPEANGESLPLEATGTGKLYFSGKGLDSSSLKARLIMPLLEVAVRAGPDGSEAFQARNVGPVVLDIDRQAMRIESARLKGPNTDVRGGGLVAFQPEKTYQLLLEGGVNLAVLQSFQPDLTASGDSTLNANVRGPLSKPDITGRMKFDKASFYLRGVPNGIDNASGVILFSGNRATIEKVTAQTGGGELILDGFLDFSGEQVSYRVNGVAEQVRVRYPEGVSNTLNASLSFTGTSTRSILSGKVTVLRSGVNPRIDLAGLLGRLSKPAVAPAVQNELLRGMQFDIRAETSPDARFETTLTQDLQAEADLRLRGTPYNPVLLGRVSITQGEVNFFGNRYTINRGDISFLNPVRLEPVLNLDLETRVRGIDVTMTFTGPLDKLSVNYRSDPPLQTNEIIALLAVGRAPTADPALAARQAEQDQSWGQIGASTLIGQALAAPVAGRLERFFGVSRIKIDPRLTGVENNPQAQLTLEQQISRDVTFTYMTNLAQGQHQVVRMEWNVSREWSILAVRDESGLFGVDFLFRKQFK